MEVVGLLEKALNVRAFYHRIVASNITNVETPGYKEKDIEFKTELERHTGNIESIAVKEKLDPDGVSGIDGNTVNIETQIVKLNENGMLFNSFVQLVNKRFSMMRYMINEGRR